MLCSSLLCPFVSIRPLTCENTTCSLTRMGCNEGCVSFLRQSIRLWRLPQQPRGAAGGACGSTATLGVLLLQARGGAAAPIFMFPCVARSNTCIITERPEKPTVAPASVIFRRGAFSKFADNRSSPPVISHMQAKVLLIIGAFMISANISLAALKNVMNVQIGRAHV